MSLDVNLLLDQEHQRAEQEYQRAEQAMHQHQLTAMEEMLGKYRDRFGELPQ